MSTQPHTLLRSIRIAFAAMALACAYAATAQEPGTAPAPADTATTIDTASTDANAFDSAREANALLDGLDAGDFATVYARFDERMAAALTEEQLRQVWSSMSQFGAAKGRGEAQSKKEGELFLVRIPLQYEKASIDALFAFRADGKLVGLRFTPAETVAASVPVPADANYAETELRIGDEATGLPATLAMPKGKGPFPAVVLVHGSGPHDRDETIGPNKPFLDIARGLAERGVAVLRYEKRSKARPQDYANGVTIDSETTDDAVAAVAMLRSQARIDPKRIDPMRIFVLGHSLGGMMAPRIGIRDPQIAGLILLAAPSRSLLDILIEQNKRMAVLNDGKTDDAEHAAIAKLTTQVAAVRRGEDVSGADAPLGAPGAYWHTVEAVDAVAEARSAKQPLLVLQGAQDIQVVDADWQRWRGAFHDDARVTFKLYEGLSHLAIPGEGTLQDYSTAGHVAPELIDDVAQWIGAQSPPRKRK